MSKYFFDANFIIAIFREIEVNNELAISKCEELLSNHECYISNAVFNEVITVLMMRIKDLDLTIKAYYFMKDNLIILNEFGVILMKMYLKYLKKSMKKHLKLVLLIVLLFFYISIII